MFKRKHRFYDDNPDATSSSGGGKEQEKTAKNTEIDIEAIKAAAYKEAEAKFKKDFEAKEKKAKADAEKQRLHEQGEFKTLLEQSQAEIALLKAEKAKITIKSEIMRNSGDIADQHKALLVKVFESEAVYEDGEVKIDGLPVDVYIAKFLKENNSYKKPTANPGSGAPGSAGGGKIDTSKWTPAQKLQYGLTNKEAK